MKHSFLIKLSLAHNHLQSKNLLQNDYLPKNNLLPPTFRQKHKVKSDVQPEKNVDYL